jgi:tRNA A-37 threonylcarbamoyl transferase component Bud32
MVEPGPPPQLVLVDVRRVRFGPPVSDEERWEQLAVLGRASFGDTSRSDRLRFLARYLGESATGPARRALARGIEARAARLVGAHARERARSARRGDARFERIARGGVRWVVHRASGSPDLDRVLAGVEAAMTASGARTLKAGRSSTVVLAPPFVIKRFNLKKTRNLVLDVLRPSRAMRALARSILLGALGIPTPPVLAAGEERRLGLVRRGYVVMDAVRGAIGLAEAVLSRRDGAALAASAGRLVAKLHALGLVHRDLKATNLLVDGRGSLVLVDLDGLAGRGRVLDGRAARDLGRLARDLRCEPGGHEAVEALLRGYLEARGGVDRAVIRRAASG